MRPRSRVHTQRMRACGPGGRAGSVTEGERKAQGIITNEGLKFVSGGLINRQLVSKSVGEP